MARTIHALLPSGSIAAAPPLLLVAAAVLAMASLVSFLCASHQHWKPKRDRKRTLPTTSPLPPPPPPLPKVVAVVVAAPAATTRAKGDRKLISSLSGIGSKALEVAKMMSWKKRDEEEEEEEAVWRKTILMGEKCRPLDFSGSIIYDCDGKLVQGFPLKDDAALESQPS